MPRSPKLPQPVPIGPDKGKPASSASMFHRASAAIEAKIPRSFPRRRNSDDQDAGPDAGSSAKFLSKSAQDGAKQQLGVYRSSTVETLRPPGDQQYTVSFSSDFRDYDLLTPIGYGSSAVVYKGVHRPNRLLVAIKIIDLDMFERRQIDELRRETQIMSLSRHPNVLEVLSAFVQDSKLYLVTPYLAGGSCLDIIKTGFRRGVDEFSIALILKQALKALDYIHRTGHIHRDVKAGNLLIDASGWVKLADFGVSSSLTDTVGSERQGVRLTFVGTPCWMAPEVIEEKAYDAKADIWSFGITALELATGEAPLANLPALKVLMTTLSKPPPALDRGNSQYKYSKSFEDLISQCLQKDPRQRPTAQGLLQHTFFRKARKTHHYGHLVTHLLQRVPVLEQRPHRPPDRAPEQFARGVSWDFSQISTPRPEERTEFLGGEYFGAAPIIAEPSDENDDDGEGEDNAIHGTRDEPDLSDGGNPGLSTNSPHRTTPGTTPVIDTQHLPSNPILGQSPPNSLPEIESLNPTTTGSLDPTGPAPASSKFKVGRFSVSTATANTHADQSLSSHTSDILGVPESELNPSGHFARYPSHEPDSSWPPLSAPPVVMNTNTNTSHHTNTITNRRGRFAVNRTEGAGADTNAPAPPPLPTEPSVVVGDPYDALLTRLQVTLGTSNGSSSDPIPADAQMEALLEAVRRLKSSHASLQSENRQLRLQNDILQRQLVIPKPTGEPPASP